MAVDDLAPLRDSHLIPKTNFFKNLPRHSRTDLVVSIWLFLRDGHMFRHDDKVVAESLA
jgi:hypothetical protein